MADKVIPLHMVPDVGSEVIEVDGERYLQSNEGMFTFYKRTKGEFSPYFLALKERKVILGAECSRCKLVRVPPFMLFCPECDFEPLQLVDMPDTGAMNSTPPITYFGHSLFQHQVPFGRGRVILDGADTALPIHVYTTRGVLTPRVFGRGMRVKVIFRDVRVGSPTDIFAVPLDEIPSGKANIQGLQENDLDWERPSEPALPSATEAVTKEHASMLGEITEMVSKVAGSSRAQRDLAGWKRRIRVATPGGRFGLLIDDGKLDIHLGDVDAPDFVMVAQDPAVFSEWTNLRGSLTNAIISERLWISMNSEFITVFKLDRLPRSIRRGGQ
jgi:uncharacterized OB-fold protein